MPIDPSRFKEASAPGGQPPAGQAPARRPSSLFLTVDRLLHSAGAVWAFCIACLFTLWTTFALYAVHERQKLFDIASQQLLGAQTIMRAHASRTFEATNTMLTVVDSWLISNSRGRTSSRPISDLKDLIDRISAFDEEPVRIRAVDSTGRLIRIGVPPSQGDGIMVGDRDYVLHLRDKPAGTLFTASPTISRDNGEYVLPVAIKAHPNTYGISYVVAAITADHFTRVYRNLLVAAPAKLGIVKDDGTVLFLWPSNSAGGRKIEGVSDFIGQRRGGEVGLVDLPDIDGSNEPTMTAYAAMALAPMAVFAQLRTSDLTRIWLGNISTGILVCVFATGAILAFAVYLSRLLRDKMEQAEALQDALIKANEAADSKKHFLASMSHELRTPLNAIIGFSSLMDNESFGPIGNPHYKAYVKDIGDAGRHLLSLIQEILDTARIDQGTIELGTTPIHVGETLKHAVEILEPMRSARKINIRIATDPNLPSIVMTKAHLQRIVFNLVGNAIKFSPPDSKVDIKASRSENNRIAIAISDNGIGIPKGRLRSLFTPFSKIDSGYVRNADGIGLGLANTKLIVEAYGGRIWLDSDIGRGTTAHIILPIGRIARSGASAA